MAGVTANDVKALRDRTGAGMMDCKKALVECNGDIENAIDFLRKKGLAAAAKKAGRIAAEGVVGVHVNGTVGTIIEINAETDFVARNDLFKNYVSTVVKIANEKASDIPSLQSESYPETGRNIADELLNLISVIGENMGLRRVAHLSVDIGVVAAYVHNKVCDDLGKVGVLVALESSGNKEKLQELGKKIAMHIVAANPQSTSIDELDPTVLARERSIVSEQALNMGKPAEFVEKIVEGRIRKFYEEVVLLEQEFVMDTTKRIKDVLADASNELGTPVRLKGFTKFVLGEGIEKQVVDFAAEVAAVLVQ